MEDHGGKTVIFNKIKSRFRSRKVVSIPLIYVALLYISFIEYLICPTIKIPIFYYGFNNYSHYTYPEQPLPTRSKSARDSVGNQTGNEEIPRLLRYIIIYTLLRIFCQ